MWNVGMAYIGWADEETGKMNVGMRQCVIRMRGL
jgi:hypothetical protein